jgi:uncharacterized protein with von Willebrand factor type A (vWA) domain
MSKIVQLREGMGTVGDNAVEMMDNWKSDMVSHSKAVIIFSDETGRYHTYAVNCNMAEALGYAAMAQEMLIAQVRPE